MFALQTNMNKDVSDVVKMEEARLLNFINKSWTCSIIDEKEDYLISACNLIETYKKPFDPRIYSEFGIMLTFNIFEMHQQFSETFRWKYRDETLEVFVAFLASEHFNASLWTGFINKKFLMRFSQLYFCYDDDVISQASTVFYNIYKQYPELRDDIMEETGNLILTALHDTRNFTYISELLELIVSLVNHFEPQLGEKETRYYNKIILPLFYTKHLIDYAENLVQLVEVYTKAYPTLVTDTIKSIVNRWPTIDEVQHFSFLKAIDDLFKKINLFQCTILGMRVLYIRLNVATRIGSNRIKYLADEIIGQLKRQYF